MMAWSYAPFVAIVVAVLVGLILLWVLDLRLKVERRDRSKRREKVDTPKPP